MATLQQITAVLEKYYPTGTAEEWDRVGLVLGDPSQQVSRVLLAVDVAPDVVSEAVEGGYDLLITHHPLFLRGTSFLPESDPKGRMVADLIRADCALYSAHTNADIAVNGVAEALAELVGLEQTTALVQGGDGTGIGRIGVVPEQTLEGFAGYVASVLPAGPTGLFVGGPRDKPITKVAVSGGAGDSLLGAARAAEADVFLTADLRHHPAIEHLDFGSTALLCGSHWATEWPWLPKLSRLLSAELSEIAVSVSDICTEPWGLHLRTEGSV